MRKLVLFLVLGVLFLQIASADSITPGFHGIRINNYITNVGDFPDYVFISGPLSGSEGPGLGMCPLKVIEGNLVGGYYKFCSVSVYLIPKKDFSLKEIEDINNEENYTIANDKFKALDKFEVIRGLETYTEVSDANTIKSISNYYEVDLNNAKTKPDSGKTVKSNLIYIYILAPLISLAIIFIIIKKRGRE